MAKSNKKDKIALVEAVRIPIDTPGDEQVEALVYPLGFRHLQKFQSQISRATIYLMQNLRIPEGATEEEIGMRVIAEAVPILMGDLLKLLKECIRFSPNNVSIEDLPHWSVPKLIEAWIVESFGEPEKRDPWKRAIERTVARLTGTELNLSQMASSFLSQPDGASTPSTDVDSPESPTEE